MARYHLVRVLPFAPDDLFQLVGDVRRYPEFVPWLQDMRVWGEQETAPGVEQLDAEAGVGFSFLRERFATRVTRDRPARTIGVSLLRGPFRKLENQWRFQPHRLGTQVDFDIDFEFRSRLLDALLRANFDTAVNKLIACFEDRAEAVCAKVSEPAA